MNESDKFLNEGKSLFYQDCQNQMALQSFNKAILCNHNDYRAYAERGNIYRQMKQYYKSIEDLNKSICLNKNFKISLFMKARTLISLNERHIVENLIQSFDEQDDSDACFHLAAVFQDLGLADKSIYYYEKSILLDQLNYKSYNNLANIFQNIGNFDQAMANLDKAININPLYVSAYHNKGSVFNQKHLGNLLIKMGQHFESLQWFDKALNLNKNYWQAICGKGSAYSDLGQYENSIQCFRSAIEINDNSTQALNGLGQALLKKWEQSKSPIDLRDALVSYDQAINIDQKLYISHAGKAKVLFLENKPDEAIQSYLHAIQLNPLSIGTKNSLAKLYIRQDKFNLALQLYDEILKANQHNYDALQGQIYCFENQGRYTFQINLQKNYQFRYEEAIELYDKMLKNDPFNQDFNINKGKLLNILGDYKQSLHLFNSVVDYQSKQSKQDKDLLFKSVVKLSNMANNFSIRIKQIQLLDQQLIDQNNNNQALCQNLTSQVIENKSQDTSHQLLQKIEIMQKQFEKMQQQIEILQDDTKVVNSILEQQGVFQRNMVKNEFEDIQKQDPDLYSYCITFYWTMLNLFGAFKQLSTGLLQGDINFDQQLKDNLMIEGAKQVTSYGSQIANGIPIIGPILNIMDNIIDDLWTIEKQIKLQQKVDAINNIIQNKIGFINDISVSLGLCAIYATKSRKNQIQQPQLFKKQSLFTELYQKIKNSLNTCNQTISVQMACQDVALFMAYFYQNHHKIVQSKLSLEAQIKQILEQQILNKNILICNESQKETNINLQEKQSQQQCNLY